ncbi:hypothetical protein EV383_5993 [Pseudonocardia sediminis]|uniref:Uncharacterized protein n=2 Tax=Pseudonocardia sediminis TaxID=1397368 RepID=A0A4Q7V8B2_PSEST|nr:hypothetical protein EV383_5993 [Pseudonocardia sediminis]
MLWEAGQFRRRYFDHDELPEPLRSVAELGDMNVVFVPRTRSRYHEFAPLLHLLPHRTLRRYGLPLLRAGQWPYQVDYPRIDSFLPGDFERRLSNAWASAIWPHLDSGSSPAAFTDAYPLSLLAHNLEFWVPPVTAMIQNRLRDFPDVKKDNSIPDAVRLVDGSVLDGAIPARPRMGGEVWFGEQDARYAIEETVEAADRSGQLRGIIEAVRANRVEEDFSDHLSHARADFERKLHHLRIKIKVRFVELTDTIPVQGPESEILGNLVINDFLTILDAEQRQIVVLLNSGFTSRTEIAGMLDYTSHSAVSRRIDKIRQAAEAFFVARD